MCARNSHSPVLILHALIQDKEFQLHDTNYTRRVCSNRGFCSSFIGNYVTIFELIFFLLLKIIQILFLRENYTVILGHYNLYKFNQHSQLKKIFFAHFEEYIIQQYSFKQKFVQFTDFSWCCWIICGRKKFRNYSKSKSSNKKIVSIPSTPPRLQIKCTEIFQHRTWGRVMINNAFRRYRLYCIIWWLLVCVGRLIRCRHNVPRISNVFDQFLVLWTGCFTV